MAKWDLSKLPEGRKPLPDEWFAERAQMQDRIKELEDKLANAVEALRFYAEGEWPKDYPGGVLFAAGDDTPEFKTHIDYGDKARTTLAELTGGKDE